ncbi:protein kinase domain-containing protein [Clostridium botulinum]|uniref:protein kinase domain-containing protein n=1 Tax=Clostridium botulinum TaxID=1491 RepID=UPI003EF9CC4C
MNQKYKYEDNKLEIYINNKWVKINFDGYEFVDKIGDGANGIVLIAKHIITERIDAIKIWLPHKQSKNAKVSEQQYLNEIRKIAKLRNNNIITIYDAKIIDNEIYMSAMEYIKSKSLEEWLEGNREIFRRIQVCEKILKTVLDYQSIGVVHGDLHGGNILIDKDDNIHLIDFGTSLFAHANQSKEREVYFIVNLVKKLLGEYFIKECFEFRNYSIRGRIHNEDDSRNYEPLLITKTLISYIELVKIKLMAENLNDESILDEYCYNISKGIYFNLDGILNEILNWNDSKIALKFVKLMYENINDTIFNVEGRMKTEDLIYSTLFIYYEIFKQNKDKIDFTETEEHYFKYYDSGITNNEYRQYINKLKNFKTDSYIGYHNELVNEVIDLNEVRSTDNMNRRILADILQVFYGAEFIIVLYKIWQKLNMLWLDKDLHNEIFKLSNIAKENGWVIE